ncbi:MAG: gliding motility-associated C-terminal domain-containing protein [Chitinophagaceae bacterium]|nr:gliding motility-associated C-terminal domain-containing protein [Chitinophagaceae bacterium]
MKRLLLAIIFIFFSASMLNAAHIKGGFFKYSYLGQGSSANTARYRITLVIYMICNPTQAQLSSPINFSIFNGRTGQFIQDVSVLLSDTYNLNKVFDEPCITGNETGCYYTIATYDLSSIELPVTADGYTISYQRCCKVAGINNVTGSQTVGNTFSITIPGTSVSPTAFMNSSPSFRVNDTIVVCRNNYFQYPFSVTDADGDSLAYSFCTAYAGGSQATPAPNTASNPPYTPVPYATPYSGSQPMGANVSIDPATGLIDGISPNFLGEFLVGVCVKEYRNGVLLGTTLKELIIRVNDCQPLKALLNPSMITCDGFTLNFSNLVFNQAGTEYTWEFGDPASGTANTSTLETPSHTFSDTGVFIVKLKVGLPGGLCADSTTMLAKVYPGFFPDFQVNGSCFLNPFQFTDLTTTNYGVVDSWSWNFGDLSTTGDTSHQQNPQWTYPDPGTRDITFIVTNSKGCRDTVQQTVNVLDKPLINLGFADTLICNGDVLQLSSSGSGNVPGTFSWTPTTNMTGANTATPTVSPTITTWYYVMLNENGCVNTDSVRVRVVDFVTLQAIPDTTICLGDDVQLGASSDGLQFSWTPTATLNNPFIINPVATPTNNTILYQVTAVIGGCSATDDVLVTTVPYPVAAAGPDDSVCYNSPAQLNASINGSSFVWTPANYLDNPNLLNPVATPPRTTQYVLSAYDTQGCPKPGRDTVVVYVYPKVNAFAGRDTVVVVGQPLQFNGSGGLNYHWSPSTYLSDPDISNPVGIYDAAVDSIQYKLVVTDEIGCADSAYVTVKVFKTNPYVFVPTAFTPNNDGLNDILRPIPVGVEKINYFNIYNRWGQLVYSTSVHGTGWDGRISGRDQNSGVFVWMVSAVDYTGRTLFFKGTVTLIRK